MRAALWYRLAVIAARNELISVGIDLVTAGDCRVRGVLAQGCIEHGIRVRDALFLCCVIDCSLADDRISNLKSGRLAKGGAFGNFIPNTAIGCTIYGGSMGVEVERAIVLNLSNIQVHQSDGSAALIEGSYEIHMSGNAFS